MKHAAAFMSQRQDWATPRAFFDAVDAEFGFTLDACASADNAKCAAYYTEADDALTRRWPGVVWMNPPYSHRIGEWVRKAYLEAQKGSTVVCLIPARTETGWWHDYVMHAERIVLIRGRLRFEGVRAEKGHNAPFPSCLVIFRPGLHIPAFETMNRDPSIWKQEALA